MNKFFNSFGSLILMGALITSTPSNSSEIPLNAWTVSGSALAFASTIGWAWAVTPWNNKAKKLALASRTFQHYKNYVDSGFNQLPATDVTHYGRIGMLGHSMFTDKNSKGYGLSRNNRQSLADLISLYNNAPNNTRHNVLSDVSSTSDQQRDAKEAEHRRNYASFCETHGKLKTALTDAKATIDKKHNTVNSKI